MTGKLRKIERITKAFIVLMVFLTLGAGMGSGFGLPGNLKLYFEF
jgi:hypothetical protein